MISEIEIKNRITKLRNYLEKFSLDGFLITNKVNMKYLTGFDGDGLLLVTMDDIVIISDERYQIELEQQSINYIIGNDYLKQLMQLVSQKNLIALGFEESIEYENFDYLDENSMADIVPVSNLIETLRAIKSESEIRKIKSANQLVSDVLERISASFSEYTERDLAIEIDYLAKKAGATGASFSPIIASGPNSALPHSTVTSRKLQNHDILIADLGYFVEGYTCDITRTFSIGRTSTEIQQLYSIVREARDEVLSNIHAGLPISKLMQTVNHILKKYHVEQYFTHGIGHGIGLSVHELPSLSSSETECLEENQVITIEPGLYLQGIGGIRIEDDILVTKKGFENLTPMSADLIEL